MGRLPGGSSADTDRMIVTWIPSLKGMFEGITPLDAKEQNVLLMLRLPRIAAAVIAGAGLGIAGSGMQAITEIHGKSFYNRPFQVLQL